MKTITKLLGATFFSFLLFSCSGDDGENNSSGDPIIGRWKQISETENGTPQTLSSCDLQEVTEFKSDGLFLFDDFDSIDGACVPNNTSEPGLTVETRWEKIATDSYRVNFFLNGQQVPTNISFTTVFSDSNYTMTTTATEEDGDIVVAVMNRL